MTWTLCVCVCVCVRTAATTMCADGALILDGACYYVSATRHSSWFTARMDCLARRGDLVRVNSYAIWLTIKSHLLANYPRQRFWIGLAAMYWYWSNGRSSTWLLFILLHICA